MVRKSLDVWIKMVRKSLGSILPILNILTFWDSGQRCYYYYRRSPQDRIRHKRHLLPGFPAISCHLPQIPAFSCRFLQFPAKFSISRELWEVIIWIYCIYFKQMFMILTCIWRLKAKCRCFQCIFRAFSVYFPTVTT